MSLRTLQHRFWVTFEAPIWQIRPDYSSGLVALEIRNGDRLQTEFAVLEAKTGKLVVSGYRGTENWWVGLEETCQRMLFLHGFGDRKLGTHQGILALEVDTQQILWHEEQAVFYGLIAENSLIVRLHQTDSENLLVLDSRTGNILVKSISPVEAHAAITTFTQAQRAELHYPGHYPEGSEYFDMLSQFISSRTGAKPVKAIDYLEANAFFAMGYYEAVPEGKIKNTLGIYASNDGTLLGEVILTEAGNGLALDSFFMMGEIIITIQERNTLLGYFVK